ncbi:beta-lactamase family [Trichoderma cornu-damae]|uniref:Beta-lactamase family n=1 Tax=Trichoderma cornu-damae TaxID=654480 RepID=A0A9P8TS69_9HYPO|nr:beta-lactamase family [Trichoderma cornu-damae]
MESLVLPAQAAADIRNLLDAACTGQPSDMPCASAVVVGAGSQPELFAHTTTAAAGRKGSEGRGDIYWLASCTKLITSIACMQLVEGSVLSLDDADQLEGLCPELANLKVAQEDGSLVPARSRITLRMLLTHTAGFGYSFLNPKLQAYCKAHRAGGANFNEFSGHMEDLVQPLVNQPGETFEYGISMDWAGLAVERATGLKLGDYMQRHIFEPLGIRDLAMVPSVEMKERLAGMWQRDEEGRLSPRTLLLSRPLGPDAVDNFHSGGAGLFGSIREFGSLSFPEILAMLLRDGSSPSGKVILEPDTVKAMFINQLAWLPNFARRHLPAVKPELVYVAEALYPPCPPPTPQGWGLGFMITPGPTGRSDTTGHWSGLSNVFWWCDRERGVAGVVASQLLPFADLKVVELWMGVESKVYESIENGVQATSKQ